MKPITKATNVSCIGPATKQTENRKAQSYSSLLMALSIVWVSGSALASINVSTGLDASDTLLTTSGGTDAHWTYTGGGSAKVVVPGDAGSGFPSWIPNGPASAWIAKDPTSTSGNALVDYYRQFNLAGYDLSTVSLSGSWTVDDEASLYLNGNLIASLTGGPWTSLHAFSVPQAYFLPGLNTLSIVMGGTDDFLEGARLEGTLDGVAVPEPTTAIAGVLVLLPFGMSTLRMLRRNRNA